MSLLGRLFKDEQFGIGGSVVQRAGNEFGDTTQRVTPIGQVVGVFSQLFATCDPVEIFVWLELDQAPQAGLVNSGKQSSWNLLVRI